MNEFIWNDAVRNLCPTATYRTDGEEIIWLDTTQTQPSEEEIATEVARLQTEYDNNQYQRDRQYPSLEEQADMAYWDRKNGTTTLDDALDAVKAEYPKPTE
jgi:hypothetical protein